MALLKEINADLPILADVSRADLLLFACSDGHPVVVAQAMPHSVTPLYEERQLGMAVRAGEQAEVWRAVRRPPNPRQVHTIKVRGTMAARQLFPVWSSEGRLIAVLAKDSYWLAHERQLRRSKVFQEAALQLCAITLRGELRGAESLTPFGEHDGIVFVGSDRRIRYMSGIAQSLYRLLGYRDSQVGRRIGELDTVDTEMVNAALRTGNCAERKDEQQGLTWIRRALPVQGVRVPALLRRWLRWWPVDWDPRRPPVLQGVLLLVGDLTEELQKQHELESTMSLLHEVHHRVKNNLQMIASIMSMQARRATSAEARLLMEESVNRILSVAVVQEFLSHNAEGVINLQEVAHRIIGQLQQGLVDPQRNIELRLQGPAIWLPADRATQCALMVNELVQNAIVHGMRDRERGHIDVNLVDSGDMVTIVVCDDGQGLPEGFDLEKHAHLGLTIVRSMAERDLRGHFRLESDTNTRAIVQFDKSIMGGT